MCWGQRAAGASRTHITTAKLWLGISLTSTYFPHPCFPHPCFSHPTHPVQAIALAPLFVWFEALFLLGYRPQLRVQLKRRVAKLIAEMDARRRPLTARAGAAAGGKH